MISRLSRSTAEGKSIEQVILDWLDTNRDYAILLIPVLAFAESCVGIGLFISGAFLLLVSATLYNNELAGLESIIPLAFAGAFLGDHVGFFLGRVLGPRFHRIGLAQKYQSSVTRAESLIRRYGGAAIFLGRFVPAIRSLIPAMVGISGFGRLRFSLLDAVACLVWSLALGLILVGIDELF